MELRKSEPLGIFNHHNHGIGNIHADFHHGGGHQQLDLPGSKFRHDFFLLGGAHFAVEQADPILPKGAVGQLLGVFHGGFEMGGGRLFLLALHGGADEISLITGIEVAADIAEGPLPDLAIDEVGAHRLAAGGQLIDDGELQIAVDDHSQGAGNGGGGHDQDMGILALLPQGGPLPHPKPVLLIGDDQPQPGKLGIGGEDGVGTDAEIEFPGGEGGFEGLLLFDGKGAGEEGHPHTKALQERGEIVVMLLGQDLGGGHQGALCAIEEGEIAAGEKVRRARDARHAGF